MPRRVLSVQSFVSAGYVGNKAAIFPLQLLGNEVDVVNTVAFSNHTGYATVGGSKMGIEHLRSIFDALESNGFVEQTHMLTGYVPGAEALALISTVVDRLRSANPNLVYLCDPVMGDQGKLYVSPEVVPQYKALLRQASIATPNDFESELLTDIRITSLESLQQALSTFHNRYNLPHAIISSCMLPHADIRRLDPSAIGTQLVCAGSSTDGPAWAISFPAFDEHFEGVGDVFSALVLAHFDLEADLGGAPSPLARAAELAIASLQSIITRTRNHALGSFTGDAAVLRGQEGEPSEKRVDRLRRLELRLVQSRDDLLSPIVRHRAVII